MGSSRCARCPGPRADRAKDECNERPDCVALVVDDPTYEAGQNEGIVKRLAQPGKVNQTVGIQIVYDSKVEAAVIKAEKEDKPLLVYSWLPRAEIMTEDRFVRVTLESFYHCNLADRSLATQQKPVARKHGQSAVSAVPQLTSPASWGGGSWLRFAPEERFSRSDTRGSAWCFRHPVPKPPMSLPLTI